MLLLYFLRIIIPFFIRIDFLTICIGLFAKPREFEPLLTVVCLVVIVFTARTGFFIQFVFRLFWHEL